MSLSGSTDAVTMVESLDLTSSQMYDGVYHSGEVAMQLMAGTRRSAAELGPHMIQSAIAPGVSSLADTLSVTYVAFASRDTDADADVAFLQPLFGSPGFITIAPDGSSVAIDVSAMFTAGFPLRTADMKPGMWAANMLIHAPSRARYRINGVVTMVPTATKPTLTIRTVEAFGNCPKYITAAGPVRRGTSSSSGAAPRPATSVPVVTELTSAMKDQVREADMMMFGTSNRWTGADLTHRGGNPGFVRVLSTKGDFKTTLMFGDYPGNGMFQTQGNILTHSTVSLLFVSRDGTVLDVTGSATVQPVDDESERLDDSAFHVVIGVLEARQYPAFAALATRRLELSPYNPVLSGPRGELEGDDDDNDDHPHETAGAGAGTVVDHSVSSRHSLKLRLHTVAEESTTVKTFSFVPDEDGSHVPPHVPGQFAIINLPDGTQRSWTISSASTVAATDTITVSVKREPHGVASRWLHDDARPGKSVVELVGIDGHFTVFQEDGRPKPVPRLLLLAGGIGVTPLLSTIRGLVHAHQARTLPHQVVSLLYSSSSSSVDDVAFIGELQRLQADAPPTLTFTIHLFLTQARRRASAPSFVQFGRVTERHVVEAEAVKRGDVSGVTAMVCGPVSMNTAWVKTLGALGVGEVLTESFDF